MKSICPLCKQVNHAPDEYRGRSVKCVHCKAEITLSGLPPTSAPPPERPAADDPPKSKPTASARLSFLLDLIDGLVNVFTCLGILGGLLLAAIAIHQKAADMVVSVVTAITLSIFQWMLMRAVTGAGRVLIDIEQNTRPNRS